MALHRFADYRRTAERRLLDHYHAALLAHGVSGYDRAALDHDYRSGVLIQLGTPVRQANHRLPTMIWWNHLDRIMSAADDLGCRELLG